MSKTEWGYFLIGGFGWFWLAARLDRLGKQLEAVSYLVRQEMAELVGNKERTRELLDESKHDRDEQEKATRPAWMVTALFCAAMLAWWWFTAGQQ
jgi:hypothetical protein